MVESTQQQPLVMPAAVSTERKVVETAVKTRQSTLEILVVDDEGVPQEHKPLPATLPDWAMDLETHHSTFQRTAVYRCTDPGCNGEHEEYRQDPRALPYGKVCGCIHENADGELSTCSAPALRRVTLPGEGVALNARRFAPLCIYERANYDALPDDTKRSLDRYYIPGRNNEPTEPGMRRIEITNIGDYNRAIKEMNRYYTDQMKDHRSMHEEYWKARRKALREEVDARQGPVRFHPFVQMLRRLMRARSDQKSYNRYNKPLDAHFHAQLIEFDQGKIQGWSAEDTGWKERRAR